MKKISLTVPLLMFLGCLHSPQALEEPSTDIQDFIAVFECYQKYCPYFAHKGIDWEEMGATYFPMAEQCTNEDELIELIAEMLSELHDTAIVLRKLGEGGRILYPYTQEHHTNYDMNVLTEHYLIPNGWAGWNDGYTGGFGWCDPAILPYAFLDTFPASAMSEAFVPLDSFVSMCIQLDVPAIILDIRMNPFGKVDSNGACGHPLMGRFAAKPYPGAVYRSRIGPEYDQYRDIRPAVYPAGSQQYTGTVLVLVGENCSDKAENMTANFINFPNVVLVGDTTRGSVSSFSSFSRLSLSDNWFSDGVTGTILTYKKHWIEGVGIPPDIFVEATEADFAAGTDPVLDRAIEMLVDCR